MMDAAARLTDIVDLLRPSSIGFGTHQAIDNIPMPDDVARRRRRATARFITRSMFE